MPFALPYAFATVAVCVAKGLWLIVVLATFLQLFFRSRKFGHAPMVANPGGRSRNGETNTMRLFSKMMIPIVVMLGLVLGPAGIVIAQDGETPTITVGSKNYTEQLILGEMLSLMLEDAGYDVDRQLNLAGTAVVHEGLVAGEIDTYVEYTGTALLLLGQELPTAAGSSATPASGSATPAGGLATPTPSVAEQVYSSVTAAYPEQFGAAWLDPLGFNNTFALAVTRETAEEYDLQTISDLQGIAGELTIGADPEFVAREDALPGLQAAYGIEFGNVQSLDVGLLYSAVDEGEVDISAAASTDGRIPALDLVLLEDDLGFFPPYFAAPVVRQELLDQAPEVADILNQLAGVIDDQTMQGLNAQVDGGGLEPPEVARTFLVEQGLISG